MNENLLDKEALDLLEFKTKACILLGILLEELKKGDGTITELNTIKYIHEFFEKLANE